MCGMIANFTGKVQFVEYMSVGVVVGHWESAYSSWRVSIRSWQQYVIAHAACTRIYFVSDLQRAQPMARSNVTGVGLSCESCRLTQVCEVLGPAKWPFPPEQKELYQSDPRPSARACPET